MSRIVAHILAALAFACGAISADIELHKVFEIPGGGWIRCNPHGVIPVYLCDPNALAQVADNGYIVMPGGLGVFLSSGREEFYYWRVSAALRAQLPDRHDLAELCGDGIPDDFARELKAEAKP
jgi:hypothetical protein